MGKSKKKKRKPKKTLREFFGLWDESKLLNLLSFHINHTGIRVNFAITSDSIPGRQETFFKAFVLALSSNTSTFKIIFCHNKIKNSLRYAMIQRKRGTPINNKKNIRRPRKFSSLQNQPKWEYELKSSKTHKFYSNSLLLCLISEKN